MGEATAGARCQEGGAYGESHASTEPTDAPWAIAQRDSWTWSQRAPAKEHVWNASSWRPDEPQVAACRLASVRAGGQAGGQAGQQQQGGRRALTSCDHGLVVRRAESGTSLDPAHQHRRASDRLQSGGACWPGVVVMANIGQVPEDGTGNLQFAAEHGGSANTRLATDSGQRAEGDRQARGVGALAGLETALGALKPVLERGLGPWRPGGLAGCPGWCPGGCGE